MWQSARLTRKYKIVMWSWLSYDYDNKVAIKQILKTAQKEIKAVDIIVVHDNEKVEERLKELLPELVRVIREKGLSFKTISV
jgi:peptidoglycan-N-acetylglucosamine deacetylase